MRELRARILKSNHLHRDATMPKQFCLVFFALRCCFAGAEAGGAIRFSSSLRSHCVAREWGTRFGVILRTVFVVIAMDSIPYARD